MQSKTISQRAREARNKRILEMYDALRDRMSGKELMYATIAEKVGVSALTVRNVIKAAAGKED